MAPFALEIYLEILFRNLERSILRNSVTEISFMERSDRLIGQCLQTSNKASAMFFAYGFRKFISNVK